MWVTAFSQNQKLQKEGEVQTELYTTTTSAADVHTAVKGTSSDILFLNEHHAKLIYCPKIVSAATITGS